MPVFESHLSDYSEWGIGRRICEERQRRELTLQDLAARSGLSIARLSQTENGLYIPDVAQAHGISRALGMNVNAFLPSDRALPYQLKRYREVRESTPVQWSPVTGHRTCDLWPLADLFSGRHLEPILVRLNPGQTPHLRHHPGLEFAFVLKGRVEFELKTADGDFREELGRGDCIYVRAHHPHRFQCLDGEPAECMHVLSSPSANGLSGFEWLPHSSGRLNGNGTSKQRTPPTTEPASLLGAELGALRRARGWTIADVAQITNVKERQIEQVENGERTPPLDVLLRFARAFGKPLRELLHDPGEEPPYYCVRRSTEIPGLPARPRRVPTDRPDAPMPNTYHPLFADFPTRQMYPYLVRIQNVDMHMLVPHSHHGHEFLYILSGEVELVTYAEDGKVSAVLGPGDSCYLDATVPHLLRGETRNPYSSSSAELIDVYWCSLGEQYLFDTASIAIEPGDLAQAQIQTEAELLPLAKRP